MIERVERKGTSSIKYNSSVIKDLCGNPDAEPFWVADMDFESPREVQEALARLTAERAYGYGGPSGLDQVFCDFVKARHGLELKAEEAVVSPGILTSLSLVIQMFDGYDVIIPMPAYQPFVNIANNNGRTIHQWPLSYEPEGEGFSLDMDMLERIAKRPGKKLLCFCSPHNPSGKVWTKDQLVSVAKICRENDISILSDEIHCDLVYKGIEHIPFITLAQQTNTEVICFMAPSKTFNIAGEHFSITLFSNPKRREQFRTCLRNLHIEGPSLYSSTAAYACYKYGMTWLDEMRQILDDNAHFIETFLKEQLPQLKYFRPQASFIVFIDCTYVKERIAKDMKLTSFFGEKANVAMNDGTWFGEDYGNFVRFNFGTDKQHIQAALERIRNAVNSL